MHKLKMMFAVLAVTFASTLYAQFMDPENSTTANGTMTKVDDLFPVIIPDHSSGDTTIIQHEVSVISNNVVVLSNTVEKVVEQTVVLSNTVEKVVEQVVVFSNQVEKIDIKVDVVSNEVGVVKATTLKSDRNALTNNMEFVSSVRSIADAGTYPIEEHNQMKADIAKYRVAFSNMSEVVVSPETNIDELKTAILTIKNAAAAILQNP